jgi:hypothetical protein
MHSTRIGRDFKSLDRSAAIGDVTLGSPKGVICRIFTGGERISYIRGPLLDETLKEERTR